MNRRTFLGTAGVCGGLSLAGCLDAEDVGPGGTDGEAYPQYDRPAYSGWPPTESCDGGGVLFAQLRLGQYTAIQRAITEDRLDTSHPVAGLAMYGSDRIATAVETLSAYPFDETLRHAVIAASTDDETTLDADRTLVEPPRELLSSTNESTDDDSESISPADVGIDLDRVALFDNVLLFEGSFDHDQFVERFGAAFEHVDTHRGISIYESRDERDGLAFALTGSRLVVPAVDDEHPTDGETVLAHSLSGYISTVGRIVDTADGQWLFETTGPAALGVGFWELPAAEQLTAAGIATDRSSVDAVFESVGSCLCAVELDDESVGVPTFEARFSGLYPTGSPSTEELQSAFAGERDPAALYAETPRAHFSALLDE